MIDRGKQNLLGVRVDAVDEEAALRRIVTAARAGAPLAVSALAVHGVMTGVLDPQHRHRLNHLDLVLPDGQPVRWALNLLHGTGLPDRVYGPRLMLELCRVAREEGWPVYLYGSRPGVLGALRERLAARFPGLAIAGAMPSRFRRLTAEERDQVVREVRGAGAALLFVGLGCPRQEVWVYEHRDRLGIPLVAVGAAFDFHAGLLPQAPALLQRAGLEWAFRLGREPRRLWRRYVLLNPLYLLLVAAQLTGLRHLDPGDTEAPPGELRFG